MADSSANGFDGLRLRHWKPERRDDGVLVLYFDRADAPVNAFSQDALIELAGLFHIAIEQIHAHRVGEWLHIFAGLFIQARSCRIPDDHMVAY